MNLILIEPNELNGDVANITGDRVRHVIKVLKGAVGDTLRIGLLNGPLGQGCIVSLDT